MLIEDTVANHRSASYQAHEVHRVEKKMLDIDFLIVGAQKAGTTTLHYFLDQHSDFFVPRTKELHFFDNQTPVGPENVKKYNNYFRDAGAGQKRGEATPIYMYYPGCMKKIRDLDKNIKIVVTIRNPIDRAYSQYWHEYKKNWEHLPFEQAITREPIKGQKDVFIRHHSYIGRSCYTNQIAHVQDLFGKDRVLVVRFEELARDTIGVTNQVIDFLKPGAQPFTDARRRVYNEARMPRIPALHHAATRLNLRFGRKIVPQRLVDLNLAVRRYPPITEAQRDLCCALLLDRDPALRDLYPDL